jgi:hypothetical protein
MMARRENFIRWDVHDRASAPGVPPRGAVRVPAASRVAGFRAVLRSTLRGGCIAFAARLSAVAAVFAVVAAAITLAVLTQDPGARAAPVRTAGQELGYAPASRSHGGSMQDRGHEPRRPSMLREAPIGPLAARRPEAKRSATRGRG